MVCAPRWAKRTSGIPVESNMQSLQIVPHTVWGFVGPVAVLLARWGFPVLCSVLPVFVVGFPDRDGQYFSPREV